MNALVPVGIISTKAQTVTFSYKEDSYDEFLEHASSYRWRDVTRAPEMVNFCRGAIIVGAIHGGCNPRMKNLRQLRLTRGNEVYVLVPAERLEEALKIIKASEEFKS